MEYQQPRPMNNLVLLEVDFQVWIPRHEEFPGSERTGRPAGLTP